MILDATPKSKWIGEPDYDFAVKDKDAGASFFQSDTDARRESVWSTWRTRSTARSTTWPTRRGAFADFLAKSPFCSYIHSYKHKQTQVWSMQHNTIICSVEHFSFLFALGGRLNQVQSWQANKNNNNKLVEFVQHTNSKNYPLIRKLEYLMEI